MPDTLSDDERTAVMARTDQFRHALIKGGVTDWEPFLDGLTGPARRSLLTELVAIELNYRWGRGERPMVEEYLTRFPELGPAENVPPELVLEEHQCRLRRNSPARRVPRRFPLFPASDRDRFHERVANRRPGCPCRGGSLRPRGGRGAQQYELRELSAGCSARCGWPARSPAGSRSDQDSLQAADRTAQAANQVAELIKNLRHPYRRDRRLLDHEQPVHVVMELADGASAGG